MRQTAIGVAVLLVLTALVVGGVFVFQRPAGQAASEVTVGPGQGPRVGEQAPKFRALDADGQPLSLADYSGRPVWVLIQTTWCSVCRAELPDVQQAADSGQIDVVAVYLREDKDLVNEYAKRMGLTLRNVPDPLGEISAAFQTTSVPTHFFIDADGRVASIRKGAMSPADIDEALALVSGR